MIFVDADTVVPASTLRATLAAWRAGAVGGGASVHLDGRLPLSARLSMPGFRVGMRMARLAAGCYVFCTRAAFEAAGGFDETLFASEEIALSKSLQRLGRVVILDETVVTSGRKARSHSGWHLLWLLVVFAARGHAMLRTRKHLGLWYGPRRKDHVKVKGKR